MRTSVLLSEDRSRKETLRRVRKDRLRRMRVVETLDTSAVFADSPVELKEGCAVSDRDNGELFLVLTFKSLSQRPIKALDICILLYGDAQPLVPYRKDDFRYSWETATLGVRMLDGRVRKGKACKRETAILHDEEFGRGVFLPLPDAFFSRLQIELARVTYADGGCEQLGLVSDPFDRRYRATRFDEIDGNLRASYTHVNIFDRQEGVHPIRVLPQEGKTGWLCCCGHKNPAAVPHCESCGRDKDWQLENLSEQKLWKVRHELDGDRTQHVPHDTSAYVRLHRFETEEEHRERVKQNNKALDNLAMQEKERKHRFRMLPVKVGLVALFTFALAHYDEIVEFFFYLVSRLFHKG